MDSTCSCPNKWDALNGNDKQFIIVCLPTEMPCENAVFSNVLLHKWWMVIFAIKILYGFMSSSSH